jgi:signal transduction histidine kinase
MRTTLAGGLRRRRNRIVTQFARDLKTARNPLIHDPLALRQCLEHARSILDELDASLALDPAGGGSDDIPVQIGETRASSLQSPGISFDAAATLFATVMQEVGALCDHPPTVIEASVALNQTINHRVGTALMSYSHYLLDNVHRAHVQERFRLGRELHDRLGNDVGAALQMSRLVSYYLPDSDERTRTVFRNVTESLSQAVEDIRTMTIQLRSLVGGRALRDVLAECPGQLGLSVPVEISVRGDEQSIPDYVREELFVVVREAIRNAGRHARAAHIQVAVLVSRTEVVATVIDDGVGLDTSRSLASGHTGLTSMGERARLLGGDLRVTSEIDAGMCVQLRVPLPGER